MQERAFADPKLEIVWNAEIAEIHGDDRLESVTLRDTVTGETRPLEVTGLFIAIGHDPRSELLTGQVDLDDNGYVLVDHPSTPPTSPASSPPATSSTTTTARRSPRPAPAAPRRWTPSATSPPSTTRRPRQAAARETDGAGVRRRLSRRGTSVPGLVFTDLYPRTSSESPQARPTEQR